MADAMRIVVPLVISMSAEQVAEYVAEQGLGDDGGRVMARDVVEDVRGVVRRAVQGSALFEFGADVSIKGR